MELVEADRNGEFINQDIVNEYARSLIRLGAIKRNKPTEIYQQYYEGEFLEGAPTVNF